MGPIDFRDSYDNNCLFIGFVDPFKISQKQQTADSLLFGVICKYVFDSTKISAGVTHADYAGTHYRNSADMYFITDLLFSIPSKN
ncbi:MAG TPA: hypothetical protein PKY88_13050 [Anaerohalosphaeraceae bacterium]|nr:hypothetical protein [Anaerohalosphaeraceae bacterium]